MHGDSAGAVPSLGHASQHFPNGFRGRGSVFRAERLLDFRSSVQGVPQAQSDQFSALFHSPRADDLPGVLRDAGGHIRRATLGRETFRLGRLHARNSVRARLQTGDLDTLRFPGVEEHFYILLPILLLLLIRFSPDSANPFRPISRAFLVVAVMCFVLRVATVYFTPPDAYYGATITTATHLRIDELFFGVLFGYFYSFHREGLDNFMRPTANRIMIRLATAVFLSTCFIFPCTSRTFVMLGPTILYLEFGGLLLLCLYVRDVLPRPLL
jgi:hypothetical protein